MINPTSIQISNRVTIEYDSRLKIDSNIIFNKSFYEFKLFGDIYTGHFNDFEISNIVILICNLNTIESYWLELREQFLLDSLLPNINIIVMDTKHKIWFRDKKINKVLDN